MLTATNNSSPQQVNVLVAKFNREIVENNVEERETRGERVNKRRTV